VRYFLTFLVPILFISCNLFNSLETVKIQFPDQNYDILNKYNISWTLEYRDHSGMIVVERINTDLDSLYLQVEKGNVQSYLLYPVLSLPGSKNIRLKPAGYIYPDEYLSEDHRKFLWQMGFEALVVLEISKYINPDSINLKRLFYEIDQKSNSTNHWKIDSMLLLQNLLSGDFRVYDIRQKRERDIEIYAPVGNWYNLNLTGENFYSTSGSELTEIRLYTGVHQFVNDDGLVIEISIQSDGEYEHILY